MLIGTTQSHLILPSPVGAADPPKNCNPHSAFFESKPPAGRIHSLDAMETSYPSPPPAVSAPAVTNVRTWNALCHASALLGVFLHFPGHLLGPLIVWLAKRDDSPEIDAHGKEALNFQISMLIYNVVAAVFCLVLVGFVFLADPLGPERRLRHHRLDPGERRKILSLPDDDPVHSIRDSKFRIPIGILLDVGFSPLTDNN